jgi:hypothetical protein
MCRVYPSLLSYNVFESRDAGLYGIRYQNELKCRCRERSGTGTGIRGPSPVLKYSGAGLSNRNANAGGIYLFISESAELTHWAIYINHYSTGTCLQSY